MRKKSHFKVYNFEFGTIKETTSTVNIDLDSTQCTHEKLKDITHIAATDDPLFLPLIDIKESKTQILLSYEKRSNLSNLIEIKKEEYPVKISIAQEILAEDILNKYQAEDIYISLNPATLYYYPMQTVRYTYVANQFMPRTQHTTLERYKACVVSILSGISYEKCLNSPEETKKIGNELIKEIYKQPTRMALLAFIKDSKDYITYNYISNNKARLQKTKRKYLGMLALAGVFLVGGVALTQVKATSNRLEIEKSYEERLNRKDLLIEANHHFSEGNYVEAVNKYKKVDYELEKLSKRLIEKEEYQLAIDLDSESLEDVIQQSYITGELEKIVDLSEENLSKKYQSKLKDEKVILSGDLSAMENVLNFLTDEQTAQRLALKYVELGNIDKAKHVQEKFPDNIDILETIQKAEAEQFSAELQTEIRQLKKEKEKLDPDNEEELEKTDKRINELEEQLTDLEQEQQDSSEEGTKSEKDSEEGKEG